MLSPMSTPKLFELQLYIPHNNSNHQRHRLQINKIRNRSTSTIKSEQSQISILSVRNSNQHCTTRFNTKCINKDMNRKTKLNKKKELSDDGKIRRYR